MPLLRREDFTQIAQEIGLWNSLLELAGLDTDPDRDDLEIEVTKAHKIQAL